MTIENIKKTTTPASTEPGITPPMRGIEPSRLTYLTQLLQHPLTYQASQRKQQVFRKRSVLLLTGGTSLGEVKGVANVERSAAAPFTPRRDVPPSGDCPSDCETHPYRVTRRDGYPSGARNVTLVPADAEHTPSSGNPQVSSESCADEWTVTIMRIIRETHDTAGLADAHQERGKN
jgi:hypothetical protein